MAGVILEELEVQNFRTFGSERFVISPEQKVILLYGNNGFGKTSFFDAVEWGITGDIRRYKEAAKEKNEYAMLQNQLRKEEPAWVNIKFSNKQFVKREIIKGRGSSDYNQGLATGDPFSWIVKPEWNDLIDSSSAFNLSHILTQELVSQFVRSTKDTDRYAALVSLFGLEGYKAYSPKIDDILKKVETKKRDLEKQKEQLQIRLEQKVSNLETVSFDVQTKKKELALLVDKPVSSQDEIKATKIHIFDELEKIGQEKFAAENKLKDIAYLEQNWAAGIKNNERINLLNRAIAEYDKLGDLCKSLQACKWMLTVKAEYLEYAEEKGRKERISTELENFRASREGEIAVLSEFNFQDNYSLFINFGLEMQGKPAMLAKELKELLNSEVRLEQEIHQLESLLEKKMDLEQRLIQVAKDFIEENSPIEKCPVCSNAIQQNEVLASLAGRLKSSSSLLFQGYMDSLKKLRSDHKEMSERIMAHKVDLVSVFRSIKKSSCTRLEQLQTALEKAQKLEKNGKIVDSWLAHLKITIDLLEPTINNLTQSIKISSRFVEDQFSDDFYMAERTRSLSDSENLKQAVTTFNRLCSKYSFDTESSVIYAKKDTEEVLQEITNRERRLSSAKSYIADIHKSAHFEGGKKEIQRMKDGLAEVESEFKIYNGLSQGCVEVSKSIRTVLGEETESLLNNYGSTIKVIYSHLNPHVYFSDINLKIDVLSNPKNNRFVLEAVDGEAKATMNPSYTFSAAQTNVLAISIFMGIALRQQWSNLNALFLDDPIQNMDDINVHSFVDIIRSIVRDTDKQIFISTHDERVFNFMRRKFREDVQVFKFIGYGEFEKL